MLGFRKTKQGRKRSVHWLGIPLFHYRKRSRSPERRDKEIADLALQSRLRRRFARDDSRGVDDSRESAPIVSLTSWGSRIETVHITLQSLFEQRRKARKIVLWLDEEEFQEASLPREIRRAMARGVEVEFVPNTYSYKKLIPALAAYPDDVIVTVDDDIMYPRDFLEGLEETHARFPEDVCCYRAHRIGFSADGSVLPYRQWQHTVRCDGPQLDILPTGAGGILYPPGCLDPEVTNAERFLELCPSADDIWLKAMSLKRSTRCIVVEAADRWSDLPPFIEGTQEQCLARTNVKDANDVQMKRVFDHYALWEKLTASPPAA